MTLLRNLTLALLLLVATATAATAQERTDALPSTPAPTVTISASTKGVRFAALGGVRQMRLEVIGEGGDSLFNSGFQAGSVRDWNLEDGRGQRLPDGVYLCVISVRDVSGRLFIKQGSVLVQGGQASLQLSEAEQAGTAEANKSLAPMKNDEATSITLTAHDGRDGQVVTTRGGLSFRAGDFFAGKDKELMRLTPEGNLGLGVTNPGAALDVAGVVRARGGIQFGDGTVLTTAARAPVTTRGAATGNNIPSTNIAGTGTANQLAKWTDGSGTLGNSSISEVNGQLGMGTTAPASMLHLAGPSGVAAITFNTPGSQRFRFQTVPGVANWGALSLNSNYSFPSGWALDDTATNGYFLKLDTRGGNGGSGNNGMWLYRIPPGGGFHTDEQPIFGASNGLAYFSGNVGIGTLNPQSPLHVVGDMKVTGNAVVDGNIAAKYQDMAEWVPARRKMAEGTVVVLDTTLSNGVVPSARAYDTHVAGVVSRRPGVILGEGGEGKVMVATTGRVMVKVDATRHPIRVGDLLVTSGKSGAAMRSIPVRTGSARLHRPGTIIGKALEPLASGQGEILVLLSLQ